MAAQLGSPTISQKTGVGVAGSGSRPPHLADGCPGDASQLPMRYSQEASATALRNQQNLTPFRKAVPPGCPRGPLHAWPLSSAVCTWSFPPSAAIRDLSLNQAGNHSLKARGVFSRRHVPGRQPECPMVCDPGIRAQRRSVEMASSGFLLETLMPKPVNLPTAKYPRNSLPESHWGHTATPISDLPHPDVPSLLTLSPNLRTPETECELGHPEQPAPMTVPVLDPSLGGCPHRTQATAVVIPDALTHRPQDK